MSPAWHIRTGRLHLSPVAWQDVPDLRALKGNPAIYGQMLGGVRGVADVAAELAADIGYWGARGVGMWMVRPAAGGPALGLTGIHDRADGRSPALRYAFDPAARGQGLGREAAGAALRFAHENARITCVFAVVRDDNIASRTVLGAIGMRPSESFQRDGQPVLVYRSVATPPPAGAWR